MTYAKATLIVWNHRMYSREEVKRAAVFIMATLTAKPEDLQQAYSVL